MRTVGVKKLKDQLSLYLQLVQQGEIISVTDHNLPIAEIRQPGSNQDTNKSQTTIEQLASTLGAGFSPAKRVRSIAQALVSEKAASYSAWQNIYEESRN